MESEKSCNKPKKRRFEIRKNQKLNYFDNQNILDSIDAIRSKKKKNILRLESSYQTAIGYSSVNNDFFCSKNNQPISINGLPDEILLKIAAFAPLSLIRISTKIRKLYHAYKNIECPLSLQNYQITKNIKYLDLSLIKKRSFCFSDPPIQNVCSSDSEINNFPSLIGLDFGKIRIINDDLTKLFPNLKFIFCEKNSFCHDINNITNVCMKSSEESSKSIVEVFYGHISDLFKMAKNKNSYFIMKKVTVFIDNNDSLILSNLAKNNIDCLFESKFWPNLEVIELRFDLNNDNSDNLINSRLVFNGTKVLKKIVIYNLKNLSFIREFIHSNQIENLKSFILQDCHIEKYENESFDFLEFFRAKNSNYLDLRKIENISFDKFQVTFGCIQKLLEIYPTLKNIQFGLMIIDNCMLPPNSLKNLSNKKTNNITHKLIIRSYRGTELDKIQTIYRHKILRSQPIKYKISKFQEDLKEIVKHPMFLI